MKKINLSGNRFGMLTVVQEDNSPNTKRSKWICRCDCGNLTSVFTHQLTSGKTQSCGCKKSKCNNLVTRKDRKAKRLYDIWRGMKKRCNLQTDKDYHRYGGSGISVCQEWNNSFMSFYTWSIENGYDDNLTIDRVDTFGNYEPDNCRWVDIKTQERNRRNNIFLTHNGETKNLSEWCEILNCNYLQKKELCRKLRKQNILLSFSTIFPEIVS